MDVYFCAAHLFPKSSKHKDHVTEKPVIKPECDDAFHNKCVSIRSREVDSDCMNPHHVEAHHR